MGAAFESEGDRAHERRGTTLSMDLSHGAVWLVALDGVEMEREYALNISQTLFKSCTFAKSHPVAETQKFVEDAIAAAPGLRLEYFEIVDGTTLQKITDWEDTDYAVGCITVFCGEVRLIDNIKYKG